MPEDEEQEITEINEDTIKQLAKQAAGGDDEEDEPEEEPEPEPAVAAGDGSPDRLAVEMERVKSTIDMLKEQNNTSSERMQNVSQSMGELRQMVHQQSTEVTQLESDVDRLKDLVEDLEPREIKKRLEGIETRIEGNEGRLEKMDERLQNVSQKANDVQATLRSLGSLDNLIELNEEFDEKISDIKEAVRYIERLASKSEKINIQINKKLSDFNMYKAKVDTLDDAVSELLRTADDLEIQIEDAVEEADLEQVTTRIHELEEQLDELNELVPLAEMSLPQTIVELREDRKDIEHFLEELEEEYEKGKIEPSEYEQIKDANEEKLEQINAQLVEEWRKLEGAAEGAAPEPRPQQDDQPDSEPSDSGDTGTEDDAEETEEDTEDADDTGDAEEEEGGREGPYEELLAETVEDIKEAVRTQNLDLNKLLELEKEGRARSSLMDWLETKVSESGGVDYEELVDQPVEDVKDAVEKNGDLNLTEVLKAERNGQNRNELLEWVEGKLTEG